MELNDLSREMAQIGRIIETNHVHELVFDEAGEISKNKKRKKLPNQQQRNQHEKLRKDTTIKRYRRAVKGFSYPKQTKLLCQINYCSNRSL